MASLRCSRCGISWPLEERFNPCPHCEEKVDPVSNVNPDDSPEEMEKLARHFEFERFYEDKHVPDLKLSAAEQERFTLANWRNEQNQKLHVVS